MKVQELTVRNLGGISYFHLVAGPHVNELCGENGSGKSSLLNALTYPFQGLRGIPASFLREGTSKGESSITLDNGLTLKLSVKEGKSPTITIKDGEGNKVNLTEIKGASHVLSFDPLAFAKMKPADQVGKLRELAGDEFVAELARRDAEIKATYDDRAAANRMVDKMGQVGQVEKVEPVDVAGLSFEIEQAEASNQVLRDTKIHRKALEDQVQRAHQEIINLQKQIAELRSTIDKCETDLSEILSPEELDKRIVDTASLRQRLVEAGETNRRAQEYLDYRKRLERRAEAAREANDLSDKLEDLRKERERFAASANLPVDGLSFGDDGVRWQGRPWDSLCSSEQWRISARIAAALAGDLKLMIVREGSLLDKSSFAELVQVCEEKGIQLWVETVGEGHSDNAIEISAGERVERED